MRRRQSTPKSKSHGTSLRRNGNGWRAGLTRPLNRNGNLKPKGGRKGTRTNARLAETQNSDFKKERRDARLSQMRITEMRRALELPYAEHRRGAVGKAPSASPG